MDPSVGPPLIGGAIVVWCTVNGVEAQAVQSPDDKSDFRNMETISLVVKKPELVHEPEKHWLDMVRFTSVQLGDQIPVSSRWLDSVTL